MAKDGTNRGGRRVRAGSKPDALADKITEGKTKGVKVMDLPIADLEGEDVNGGADMVGNDMPKPHEYLSALQRDGKPLGADEIYEEMWYWLKERGCNQLVNPRLIESFALSYARYVQCENAVSSFGLLGKHPTTGAAIANPFVQMAQSYHKQDLRNMHQMLRESNLGAAWCIKGALYYMSKNGGNTMTPPFLCDIHIF